MKAEAISGLICIVNTELGQKPKVSLKNSASFLTSKLASGERGFTKGISLSYVYSFIITFLNNQK
jgi:hypothetical protein